MSYTVPLRFGETNASGAGAGTATPSEGTIAYKADKATLDACEGFFVFSYYIRDSYAGEDTFKQSPIYLEGLYAYTSIIKGTFENWKMILYTDQYTYDEMKKLEDSKPNIPSFQGSMPKYRKDKRVYNTILLTQKLLENKNIIFAIVSWANHQRREKPQVNGPALRLMRTRTPFDFPNKYCFTRDADTLFEKDITEISSNTFEENDESRNIVHQGLYNWENKFYEILGKDKNLLIVGTEAGYSKEFHLNEVTGWQPPFGIYAGFTNVTPDLPMYTNKALWNAILDYVNYRSFKLNTKRNPKYNKYITEIMGYNSVQGLINVSKRKGLTYNSKNFKNVLEKMPSNLYKENEAKENLSEYFEFSNNSFPESVGRDEQVLLFFLIPHTFDNVFFFRVNYQAAVEKSQFIKDGNKLPNPALPELDKPFHKYMKGIYKEYSEAFLETFKGGKRKKKTLRLKIEKRKTRKRS